MQTYLKTRPVWIQLLLFIGMAFGILMVVFLIGGVILSQITGISLLEMNNPAAWDPKDPNILTLIRGMLLLQFLGMFLIPSLLFAYFSDPQPLQYIGLKPPAKALYWIAGISIMLVAVPMVEYTGLFNRDLPFAPETRKWMQSMEDEAARTLKVMLGSTTLTDLLLNVVFIAAFAGVGEELFFRGVIQRLFIRATKSPWAGIIIAAFLFSFFHFQFFGFIPRFLLGILLGAIYWYSGSLWPAILAHFVYDAFFITLAYFNPELVTNADAQLVDKSYLTLAALGSTALVVLLVWLMKKNSTTDYNEVYRDDLPSPSPKDFSF
jgi:uncharacterized protein